MRGPKLWMFALSAVLGVATVLAPAIASSESPPTISAYSYKVGASERRYWLPETAHVAEGASVDFANNSAETHHGLKFTGGPATPSCSGLPPAAGEAIGATSWKAECSFSKAGTYTFICTVHPLEMKGSVIVGAAGETTTTTTVTSTPSYPTNTTTPPPPPASEPGPLLAGAPAAAVTVARSQHGRSLHGSVLLGAGAAGGSLSARLFTTRASLASSGASLTEVGRATRSSLKAGRLSFTVALNRRARSALRRHGHLALVLKLLIRGADGSSTTAVRKVTLRS